MDKRSLAGYIPWGQKKLDMTEQLNTHTHTHTHTQTHQLKNASGFQKLEKEKNGFPSRSSSKNEPC